MCDRGEQCVKGGWIDDGARGCEQAEGWECVCAEVCWGSLSSFLLQLFYLGFAVCFQNLLVFN